MNNPKAYKSTRAKNKKYMEARLQSVTKNILAMVNTNLVQLTARVEEFKNKEQ